MVQEVFIRALAVVVVGVEVVVNFFLSHASKYHRYRTNPTRPCLPWRFSIAWWSLAQRDTCQEERQAPEETRVQLSEAGRGCGWCDGCGWGWGSCWGTSPLPEKLKVATIARFEGVREARNDDSFTVFTGFWLGR